MTPSRAEQRLPSPGVEHLQVAAATTVSGVLRDATTGGPIRNGCVAWRPTSVTPTATNGTTRVGGKGRWEFDAGDPGPFYISFYVTDDGDCSHAPLTGSDNYRASWYRGHPFTGTNPSTALPPPGADAVAAGSNVVACLATHNALPTACATPNRTASGRVVSFGNAPIDQACIVAIGADDIVSDPAISNSDGRWTLTGLPINYDYIVIVIPPFQGIRGPCDDTNGPPPGAPAGALQPEFYDDTWADFSDQSLRENPFGWATDPDSPHPAVTMRNNRAGIDVCLTTETGRNTERSSCDPGTPTPSPTASATASPSTQPTLAATGGPSLLTSALGAALLLGAVGLLALFPLQSACWPHFRSIKPVNK